MVLSGQGALVVSGRWHSAGLPIVYCATSEALAVIELRVHLGRFVPKEPFDMHAIELPDFQVTTLQSHDWPTEWNAVPPARASQRVGDAWLASAASLSLQVPSIHSRSDFNVLINPVHPAIRDATVAEHWPYRFDERLLR
jgi:RES domain-containing protein